MVRRAVKRNIRISLFLIFTGIVLLGILFLLAFSLKSILPFVKIGSFREESIIKPVLGLANLEQLSAGLSQKNILMESLAESSSSGLFIGKVKDGPRVYFTQTREAKWQVDSLELILRRLTIDNKKPTLIDFRFDQPIVKF